MRTYKLNQKKPYISFVVVGRNDDYGYKFLDRFQNFLDNLIYLCEKYRLPSELIIVEWNPPKEKPRLYNALNINKNRKFLNIRFIEVPHRLHQKFENSDKLPLFEYVGKNVGIRRANGEFVLATNPDIIFNAELIEFLSKQQLEDDCFYRIARYDLRDDIPKGLKKEKLLTFCKKKYFCYNGVYFAFIKPKNVSELYLFFKLLVRKIARSILMFLFRKKYFYLWIHGGCPGDFILMKKENWFKIRGFSESGLRNGIDGLATIMAHFAGFKMVILKDPLRIYHQNHARADEGKPKFTLKEYLNKIRKMQKKNSLVHENDLSWGLRGINLKEKRV
ncbi:MAG: hypothetical protein QXS37_05750 [Candidatus Aenigmatarchaeota archaeon]